eukprot:gb/GECG01002874.1/.p1 GENE.gb/GECG01002874.1/~~gb/GECG01002874.1/.p1  ORF type:complete len:104 (+),score=5.94 gb/GECG01002874.1/:1-312(+)
MGASRTRDAISWRCRPSDRSSLMHCILSKTSIYSWKRLWAECRDWYWNCCGCTCLLAQTISTALSITPRVHFLQSANQRFLAMQANANSEVDTTSSGEAPQER